MSKFYQIVQGVGAVLLLAGAMLQITHWEFSSIIYTLGAVMFSYVQIMSRYEGKNLIVRRLRRQQILAAVLFVFAVSFPIRSSSLSALKRSSKVLALIWAVAVIPVEPRVLPYLRLSVFPSSDSV